MPTNIPSYATLISASDGGQSYIERYSEQLTEKYHAQSSTWNAELKDATNVLQTLDARNTSNVTKCSAIATWFEKRGQLSLFPSQIAQTIATCLGLEFSGAYSDDDERAAFRSLLLVSFRDYMLMTADIDNSWDPLAPGRDSMTKSLFSWSSNNGQNNHESRLHLTEEHTRWSISVKFYTNGDLIETIPICNNLGMASPQSQALILNSNPTQYTASTDQRVTLLEYFTNEGYAADSQIEYAMLLNFFSDSSGTVSTMELRDWASDNVKTDEVSSFVSGLTSRYSTVSALGVMSALSGFMDTAGSRMSDNSGSVNIKYDDFSFCFSFTATLVAVISTILEVVSTVLIMAGQIVVGLIGAVLALVAKLWNLPVEQASTFNEPDRSESPYTYIAPMIGSGTPDQNPYIYNLGLDEHTNEIREAFGSVQQMIWGISVVSNLGSDACQIAALDPRPDNYDPFLPKYGSLLDMAEYGISNRERVTIVPNNQALMQLEDYSSTPQFSFPASWDCMTIKAPPNSWSNSDLHYTGVQIFTRPDLGSSDYRRSPHIGIASETISRSSIDPVYRAWFALCSTIKVYALAARLAALEVTSHWVTDLGELSAADPFSFSLCGTMDNSSAVDGLGINNYTGGYFGDLQLGGDPERILTRLNDVCSLWFNDLNADLNSPTSYASTIIAHSGGSDELGLGPVNEYTSPIAAYRYSLSYLLRTSTANTYIAYPVTKMLLSRYDSPEEAIQQTPILSCLGLLLAFERGADAMSHNFMGWYSSSGHYPSSTVVEKLQNIYDVVRRLARIFNLNDYVAVIVNGGSVGQYSSRVPFNFSSETSMLRAYSQERGFYPDSDEQTLRYPSISASQARVARNTIVAAAAIAAGAAIAISIGATSIARKLSARCDVKKMTLQKQFSSGQIDEAELQKGLLAVDKQRRLLSFFSGKSTTSIDGASGSGVVGTVLNTGSVAISSASTLAGVAINESDTLLASAEAFGLLPDGTCEAIGEAIDDLNPSKTMDIVFGDIANVYRAITGEELTPSSPDEGEDGGESGDDDDAIDSPMDSEME